jgi:agmatinase
MYERDLLPSFAGINTFARAPEGIIDNLSAGDVAVVGIPLEITPGARQGTREGPRSIRNASADFIYELQASTSGALIDINTGRTLRMPSELRLTDLGDLSVDPSALNQATDRSRSIMEAIVGKSAFPVAIGGDHIITYPLVESYVAATGKKVGLVQLSSQLDLADPDTEWGENGYGATLRHIIDGGSIDPKNIVFVGTQGYITHQEWSLAQSLGATVITADSAREKGPEATAQQALETAGAGADIIYLSLDVDVVDSGYASGTGEVVIGGLKPIEVLSLMRELSKSDAIGAMDVVEVAPSLDVRGRTERLAAEAIIELIAPKVFGA